MVSPTVKLNNRPSYNSMQATPSHTLVPVESFTNSPTSSTGSASILDWNSNSDGELLQLSSPTTLTATPPLQTLSPSIVFSLPLADDSRLESSSDIDDPFITQWEMTPAQYTPFFDGLMAPAPICRGDSVAVSDDDSTAAVDSTPLAQDAEVVKLCNEFEEGFWTDNYRNVSLSPSTDVGPSPPCESPSSTGICSNQEASLTSTIIIPHLPDASFSASMTTTAKSRNVTVLNAITSSPPQNLQEIEVPHTTISSVMPSDSSAPTPVPAQEDVEALSIGEYLQRKALSAEDLAPRATTPPVEVPSRPTNTNSGLSYFTQPNSPVSPNVEVSSLEVNGDGHNGHDNDSDAEGTIESTSPTPIKENNFSENRRCTWRPPPIVSVPAVQPFHSFVHHGRSCDDLLSRGSHNKSPAMRAPQSASIWPPSLGLFWNLPSPTRSEQDLHSVLSSPRYCPVGDSTSSPCTSRASSPRAPVLPSANYPVHSASLPGMANTAADTRTRYSLSPEFPRRNLMGFLSNSTHSPEFPRRTPDSDIPNISSLLNTVKLSQPGETPATIPRPLPRSAFSSSPASFNQELEFTKSPSPNVVPQWRTDTAKSSQFTGSNTSAMPKLRPPLPPVPIAKYDATPQFSLRSDLARNLDHEHGYFAEALPSSWSNSHLQGTPSPPPFSPQTNWNDVAWPSPNISAEDTPQSMGAEALPTVTPFPHPVPYLQCGNNWNWPYRDPALSTSCPSTNVPMSNPPVQRSPFFLSPVRPPFQGQPPAQYTGSTLPRDRKLPTPASPNWDPPPRRLRFAPLPSTPNYRSGAGQPPIPAMPSYISMPPPSFYNNNYIYQTPLPHPVIPQIFPNPNLSNINAAPAMPLNVFSNNTYPSSKKYWFADATVVFRVEDCLYRVHRHFFDRHSDTLSRQLATYWHDPTNHVFLPDVKKIEFERLLSIFYPTDLVKPDITTVSGWTSVLALGQKWQMIQIKALAIQKLGPLTTAVEKIAIAKKYTLPANHEWLLPAYTELCSRRSPLSLEEAEDLDLPTVMKIWEVQNNILNLTYRGMCSDSRITELVKEKFGFTNYSFWEFGPDGAPI